MNMFLTAILTASILVAIAFLTGAVLFYQVRKRFYAFIDAPDEKTPSQFAQVMDISGRIVGRSIAMEIKTTLMGKASGDARADNAMMADMAEDLIAAKSPAAAAIMTLFPTLTRRLRKSPALATALLSQMANYKGGNNHKETSQAQFEL